MGSVFHRAGRSVRVWLHPVSQPIGAGVDVTIIDTDSRLDPPEVAHGKVSAATRALVSAGCTRFHKKTCSVFRGNIGAEFEAMVNQVGTESAIVSLVYPALGRSTVRGSHYVHGVPLHETAFARDPVHPSTTPDLAAILARQSRRSAGVVSLPVVRSGVAVLRAALRHAASLHSWVIVDGETVADLQTLATAAADFVLLGGAAGLAEAWPTPLPPPRDRRLSDPTDAGNGETGTLIVCGSLTPQSLAQVNHLRATGIAHRELSAATAASTADCARWTDHTAELAAAALRSGRDFLVCSEPVVPSGKNRLTLARAVSAALAVCVQTIFARSAPAALVVAGGDTSGGICRMLDIEAIDLLGELAPGVPLGRSCGKVELPIVLKSGSFGEADFLVRAARIAGRASLTSNLRTQPCSTA